MEDVVLFSCTPGNFLAFYDGLAPSSLTPPWSFPQVFTCKTINIHMKTCRPYPVNL